MRVRGTGAESDERAHFAPGGIAFTPKDLEPADRIWLPDAMPGDDREIDPAVPVVVRLPAALKPRSRWLQALRLWTRDWNPAQLAQRELDLGTGFVLVPILFAIGVSFYLGMVTEPGLRPLLSGMALFCLLLWLVRHRHAAKLAVAAGLVILAGATTAKLAVMARPSTMLAGAVTTTITGIILDAEQVSAKRDRILVAVEETAKPKLKYAPRRVRLSVNRGKTEILPGDRITLRARLSPPGGPVRPGGYDFAFQAWFSGLDATGFALAPPDKSESASLWSASATLAKVRNWLTRRIISRIDGSDGAIAAALITGHKSGIDEDAEEALRTAGLAHILAISGLHMALVAGTIAGSLRAVLALFPELASRHAVRKWAAGAALAAAAFYLLISGGAVATQRSFIMLAVMLLALLVDRSALTMRNLAIAALIVLVIAPAELAGAGFQMSFAATAALIAAYAGIKHWRLARAAPVNQSIPAKLFRAVLALGFTALIAGIATGVFGAYHFQRIAPLGMLGNLAAMPIVTLVIMPSAVAALLLLPFDLDGPFFWLMGEGIRLVVVIAAQVEEMTGQDATGPMPRAAMLWFALALGTLTLLATRLRLIALPMIIAGTLAISASRVPDGVVNEDGDLVAVRIDAGTVAVTSKRTTGFVLDNWKRLWPGAVLRKSESVEDTELEKFFQESSKGTDRMPSGFRCSMSLCLARTSIGQVVALAKSADALSSVCGRADLVVVSDASISPRCETGNESSRKERRATVVIGAKDLALKGSAEFRFADTLPNEPKLAPWPSPDPRPPEPDQRIATLPAVSNQKPPPPYSGSIVIAHALEGELRPWHAHRIHSRAARGLAPWKPKDRKEKSKADKTQTQKTKPSPKAKPEKKPKTTPLPQAKPSGKSSGLTPQ